jgi:hypothetical protein
MKAIMNWLSRRLTKHIEFGLGICRTNTLTVDYSRSIEELAASAGVIFTEGLNAIILDGFHLDLKEKRKVNLILADFENFRNNVMAFDSERSAEIINGYDFLQPANIYELLAFAKVWDGMFYIMALSPASTPQGIYIPALVRHGEKFTLTFERIPANFSTKCLYLVVDKRERKETLVLPR